MPTAVIVDALRTAGGKRNGKLSGWHPADLAAEVLKAIADRNGLDPAQVDDVIMGCVMQVGDQSVNIGRNAVLAAGFPDTVVGTTIDRQCGSSQQAAHFAAQAVLSGTSDLVVAGGVQSMSLIPISAAMLAGEAYGFADPFSTSEGWLARYGAQEVSQFRSAEMIAEKWDCSREDMERFALESHRRAIRAIDEGRFRTQIVPYESVRDDEGPRRDTSLEKMATLKPLREGGRITAAVSSQISDAAAAMLIASERAVQEHGLRPRARFHHLSVRGADPVWMLTAPIPATAHALRQSGLRRDDIDLVEINEAFAPVVLAWEQEHHPDMTRVNVNGGAIAIGHPLGASGAR
ncbi:MAG: acetyl-CoA C-acyltransferase, partial [Chloroflexi bacterium]|nr:acetyl-CoA C-acyltransferase [Chloroflexota bacterium]